MIIYSVTITLSKDIELQWINYMKNEHIPEVMNTGYFDSYQIRKEIYNDSDNVVYNIEYICKNIEDLSNYQRLKASKLQQDHTSKFKGKFTAGRKIYQITS